MQISTNTQPVHSSSPIVIVSTDQHCPTIVSPILYVCIMFHQLYYSQWMAVHVDLLLLVSSTTTSC